MNKYLLLLVLPFTLWMCKPQSVAPKGNEMTAEITFDKVSPGTLTWSANAGWDAIGTFDKWKFVDFNIPNDDFTKISAKIAVQISSVNHEDKGLENHLRQKDYLAAKAFPVAMITIDGATLSEESNLYTTYATVDLKGVSQSVELIFNVEEGEPTKIEGQGMLFRENYKVGDDSGVENEVQISFNFDLPK